MKKKPVRRTHQMIDAHEAARRIVRALIMAGNPLRVWSQQQWVTEIEYIIKQTVRFKCRPAK